MIIQYRGRASIHDDMMGFFRSASIMDFRISDLIFWILDHSNVFFSEKHLNPYSYELNWRKKNNTIFDFWLLHFTSVITN